MALLEILADPPEKLDEENTVQPRLKLCSLPAAAIVPMYTLTDASKYANISNQQPHILSALKHSAFKSRVRKHDTSVTPLEH